MQWCCLEITRNPVAAAQYPESRGRQVVVSCQNERLDGSCGNTVRVARTATSCPALRWVVVVTTQRSGVPSLRWPFAWHVYAGAAFAHRLSRECASCVIITLARLLVQAVVEAERRRDDGVAADEQRALHPVAAPVQQHEGADEDGEQQHADLEGLEVEGEGLPDGPADDHEDGDDEHGDLGGGPDADAEGDVQAVLPREDEGGRLQQWWV